MTLRSLLSSSSRVPHTLHPLRSQALLTVPTDHLLSMPSTAAQCCRYLQLRAEDYNWWWRSFHRGGSTSIYLLISSFIFLYNYLPTMHGISVLLYISCMLMVILATHLCLGAVGFAASLVFVRTIYSRLAAAEAGSTAAPAATEHLLEETPAHGNPR